MKWEYVVDDDRDLCETTLTSLNLVGIEHGDARTSNFVIVGKQAIILDFGFSKRKNILYEQLKDDEMVKS
jgi:tRNA A-37 threonylcarbamoyl transferase component Bud32